MPLRYRKTTERWRPPVNKRFGAPNDRKGGSGLLSFLRAGLACGADLEVKMDIAVVVRVTVLCGWGKEQATASAQMPQIERIKADFKNKKSNV